MDQNSQPKWEAKVCTKLAKATADQVFAVYKDFFNLHKWFPNLPNCYGLDGNNGEPGCIRYCSGFTFSASKDGEGGACSDHVGWSKERLVAIDHVDRRLVYEIVDNNIGFRSYVSTVKIVPEINGGCMIEWSFAVDPVQGWKLEDFVKKYEVGLQLISKTIEDSL